MVVLCKKINEIKNIFFYGGYIVPEKIYYISHFLAPYRQVPEKTGTSARKWDILEETLHSIY
jgi:hypothetical protein